MLMVPQGLSFQWHVQDCPLGAEGHPRTGREQDWALWVLIPFLGLGLGITKDPESP